MSPLTIDQIKSAAMDLQPIQREALAEALLLSLTEQDANAIDAAWLVEIKRREKAFAKKTGVARPVEQILEALDQRAAQ
jgi:hypothetical protein